MICLENQLQSALHTAAATAPVAVTASQHNHVQVAAQRWAHLGGAATETDRDKEVTQTRRWKDTGAWKETLRGTETELDVNVDRDTEGTCTCVAATSTAWSSHNSRGPSTRRSLSLVRQCAQLPLR